MLPLLLAGCWFFSRHWQWVLVAYTDGVSEAFSPRGEEFGEERLAEIVAATQHLSAATIVERVAEAVEIWRDEAPAHDDFTLVIARVL